MLVLRAACRTLHHSLHTFILEATGRLGSHKYTSKTFSPVYSVQPWSWVVTGPSLSSPFPDSALAILMAASSQAVPVSRLSDGRQDCRISVQWLACVPREAPWSQGREILILRSCFLYSQFR